MEPANPPPGGGPGGPAKRTGRWSGWRLATPLALALAGALLVTSAVDSHGTDLRPQQPANLVQIVSSERQQITHLQEQSKKLQEQVAMLSRSAGGSQLTSLNHRLATIEAAAGLTPLSGQGIVVTLNDAPYDEPVPSGTDPDLLLVHQQDIQAVVNAMWAGGADGVTVAGQRIIQTTGIKCVGNTVVLQGVPYSPPYRIAAVGSPQQMNQALLESPGVRTYREYVAAPYNLGWSLALRSQLKLPAFTGSVGLSYAQPH